MAIYDRAERDRWRRMNNIRGLLVLAVGMFVGGIVLSTITGLPAYGASICPSAIIVGFLGFYLLWRFKGSGRVTVVTAGGGQTSTTVHTSASITMARSYEHQRTMGSRSYSLASVRQSSRTDGRRSGSVAHLHNPGVMGWGGAPSSQPVDNGWMSSGGQPQGGIAYPPPPPHGGHLGTSQPGGYTQPGGHPGMHPHPTVAPHPGGYTQPSGFTNPSSSTAGGFTNPAEPSHPYAGPGPSSFDVAPPSYEDAVRLSGKH